MEPTMQEIKELVDEQTKQWKAIETSLTERDKEIKKLGTESAETKTKLEKQVLDFGKTVDDARKLADDATKRLDSVEITIRKAALGGTPEPTKSIGQIVAESEEVKEWNQVGMGKSKPVLVKKFFKELWSDTTSAGDLILPYRIPGIIGLPQKILRIRDLLAVAGIGTPLIEYVRETLFGSLSGSSGQMDGNAGVTEEKHEKPQANFRFSKEQETAATIATWVPASKQIIADAQGLRGYVDTRLLYSLLNEEELQILFGDGTGGSLEGICTLSTVFNRAQPGDTLIDMLRRMITQVQLARYPATGFVISIEDWETIELIKTTIGGYVFANPNSLVPARVWGLPVAVSESMVQPYSLCGAFGLGAQMFVREDGTVTVGYIDRQFVENMITILAEERILLPVYRPQAFVYGPLVAPSS